jgi:Fic family protein
MRAQDNQRIGRFLVSTVGGETVRAYVPPALPPVPPVRLDSVQLLLEQANQALGRLDGLASFLPDLSIFIYAYVRKEALLSSQIEGTQSSLSDLLLFENEEVPGVPIEDVQDVSNYVAALSHGLKRIREGFPLSLRLIREIHEILLSRGRGSNKEPGEFRRSQNWIGGTRPGNAAFVPPPPELVMECMGQLEIFLHMEARDLPLLVRAALVHVQFESIHPFLDGNGRLARLLIIFLLCAGGALSEPILYLSLHFKSNRGGPMCRREMLSLDSGVFPVREGNTQWSALVMRDAALQCSISASNPEGSAALRIERRVFGVSMRPR